MNTTYIHIIFRVAWHTVCHIQTEKVRSYRTFSIGVLRGSVSQSVRLSEKVGETRSDVSVCVYRYDVVVAFCDCESAVIWSPYVHVIIMNVSFNCLNSNVWCSLFQWFP